MKYESIKIQCPLEFNGKKSSFSIDQIVFLSISELISTDAIDWLQSELNLLHRTYPHLSRRYIGDLLRAKAYEGVTQMI